MQRWARRGWRGGGLAMRIKGLAEIATQFDAMLIDQFGVIHDGQKLYAGTCEVLAKLQALKIPVMVMTNSGKRAAANVARLVKMGVPRAQFVDAVSSGEVAFQTLQSTRAFVIGKRGEDYGFDGIELVNDPALADVMLILGSNVPETSMEDYRKLLNDVKLPAICCNPDKLMITSNGLQPAPGAIAALYESMGGAVTWIGKPYPSIYLHALKLMGHPKRVLCIGDSAEHDVAGGRGAGLSTLLVQQGVSAVLQESEIEPQPDYICETFTW
jgi:HAD superfamily hydrolase (TIGR01459 family)